MKNSSVIALSIQFLLTAITIVLEFEDVITYVSCWILLFAIAVSFILFQAKYNHH
jgi:hypothetical protein